MGEYATIDGKVVPVKTNDDWPLSKKNAANPNEVSGGETVAPAVSLSPARPVKAVKGSALICRSAYVNLGGEKVFLRFADSQEFEIDAAWLRAKIDEVIR